MHFTAKDYIIAFKIRRLTFERMCFISIVPKMTGMGEAAVVLIDHFDGSTTLRILTAPIYFLQVTYSVHFKKLILLSP